MEIFNTPPTVKSNEFWFVPGGFCTYVVGDRAVSVWVSANEYPEVKSTIMAVLWIPSKKVNTRVGEMRFDTQEERELVWKWLTES